ncbi:MAG: glycosyltransferase [Desulfurococcaceae archaeon]
MLEILVVLLVVVHFLVPISYYTFVKSFWLRRPWGLNIDENYLPYITIIVPTYNEEENISNKLENIYLQDYPKDRVEIIVVDSASRDRTVEKVREWMKARPDIRVTLIEEPVRRGFIAALNYALQFVPKHTEVVIFTDADSFWERDTLRRVLKYFADERVGAVTIGVRYMNEKRPAVGNTYRHYFNIIRLGESKYFGTPVLNGVLGAFRFKLLKKIGELPQFTANSNDSTLGSIIAFMGYRSIQVDETEAVEPMREDEIRRKIRRAQHLILSFLKTKSYVKERGVYVKTPFDKVWRMEWYLTVLNPWLLIAAMLLAMAGVLFNSSLVLFILLACGFMLLAVKTFRMWIIHQLILVIAAVKNLWTKELVWKK